MQFNPNTEPLQNHRHTHPKHICTSMNYTSPTSTTFSSMLSLLPAFQSTSNKQVRVDLTYNIAPTISDSTRHYSKRSIQLLISPCMYNENARTQVPWEVLFNVTNIDPFRKAIKATLTRPYKMVTLQFNPPRNIHGEERHQVKNIV